MKRVFCLIDGNNFYASCERSFNPHLIGKPVIILSNGDGCVVARSNEAKAIGIKMAQPVFQIRDVIRRHKVYVFSSNYALYSDMSRRLIETCKHYTPHVELYSIDEAFLDFTRCQYHDMTNLGREIKRVVQRGLGLPTCLGFGPTKALAKVANHFAKRIPSFQGVLDLSEEPSWQPYFEAMPISDLWGVGRQYSRMLESHGITTVWQFVQSDPNFIRKKMTVVGLKLQQELQGTSCYEINSQPEPKQMIAVTRTFGCLVDDYSEIQKAIGSFVISAAIKLRRQNSAAREINVYIKTCKHSSEPRILCHYTLTLLEATDYTPTLIQYALQALAACYRPGFRYKKGGVMLSKICHKEHIQRSLFNDRPPPGQAKLMQAVDHINRTMGPNTIVYGIKGLSNTWQHIPTMRSPRYTTQWNELPSVK